MVVLCEQIFIHLCYFYVSNQLNDKQTKLAFNCITNKQTNKQANKHNHNYGVQAVDRYLIIDIIIIIVIIIINYYYYYYYYYILLLLLLLLLYYYIDLFIYVIYVIN